MDQPALEVAQIFREHGPAYRNERAGAICPQQYRAMQDIERCRTAELGGHIKECDDEDCDHQEISYNSCRNRHCPKCQSLARARWLLSRKNELLPVDYYHLIFTIPDNLLVPIALQNKYEFYSLLLRATARALLTTARNPQQLGADIGFIALLHTWGQKLTPHPHVHCVVPGGGLASDTDRWVSCSHRYFLSVQELSRQFQEALIKALRRAFRKNRLQFQGSIKHLADPAAFDQHLKTCNDIDWVVYAKPPFGGPEKVLDYLARYTHRVAMSNHRLVNIEDGKVTFTWRDYKNEGLLKEITLRAQEFIRRFLLHIFPRGFTHIRYYGLFANPQRTKNIRRCRVALNAIEPISNTDLNKNHWSDLILALTGKDPLECPKCHRGRLITISTFLPGDPTPILHARSPP